MFFGSFGPRTFLLTVVQRRGTSGKYGFCFPWAQIQNRRQNYTNQFLNINLIWHSCVRILPVVFTPLPSTTHTHTHTHTHTQSSSLKHRLLIQFTCAYFLQVENLFGLFYIAVFQSSSSKSANMLSYSWKTVKYFSYSHTTEYFFILIQTLILIQNS